MVNATVEKTIRQAALELAKDNAESEPAITKIYLFPHESQIRLVAVDPTTLPSKAIEPFYFAAAPQEGIPYRSAIALILPEEDRHLPTPSGWSWNEAETIWSREEMNGN